MTIKSDKWIIDQSERNDLIKPFESSQVREINGEKILEDLNISPNLSPENLSVIDFCKIAKKFNSI